MRLDEMTWPAVAAWIEGGGRGVLLPAGSTEQHGPMGLIGTDALCATAIAEAAAPRCRALVAPTLAYTPAPFNTGFPGTVSVPATVFAALAGAVIDGLAAQGFAAVYVLNAHGANLEPLAAVAAARPGLRLRLRSWWDFAEVNALRAGLYGEQEGMHATPSEIAITMAVRGPLPVPEAAREAPRLLSEEERRARAGDRHGPPERHRAEFPDGRVGAHSALARAGDGARLLEVAAGALARDFAAFAG